MLQNDAEDDFAEESDEDDENESLLNLAKKQENLTDKLNLYKNCKIQVKNKFSFLISEF